ncbi:MAG: phosphoglycerate dehydrogenase [Candidatus Limnocylindrales bacterium]
MRVLVAEKLAPEGVALLQEEHEVDVRVGMSREEYLAVLPEYEALLVRSGVKADAEAIAAGKKLIVIGRAGVGVDNIDIPAATAAGITVVNAPTGNTTAAAEHTIALLFALMRRIPAADASMHSGAWDRAAFMGRELVGKTLGVIGLGKIGMAVADRARALDMRVVGYDPYVTEEAARLHGIERLSVPEILVLADAITVHVPKTKDTANLISTDELASMKPDAVIINVARGGVVDEAALAAALEAGTIAGAAVDVYSSEPPAQDNPLLTAPNIILTPHLGASTAEAQTRVAVEAAEQVREVLAGRSARYAINAPMLTPETADALAPYLPLARTLGQFYAQFSEDLSDLTLEVAGELSEFDAGPLVAAALGGILEQSTEERVNVINAGAMAKARGISLSTHHTSDAGRFSSLLTLKGGERSVAGTVSFGNEPRLVALDGYEVDLAPAAHMLVSRHQDRPGAIGTVGRIMGEADINISNMHLGRSDKRSIAFMILALDEEVPEPVADEVRAYDGMLDVWLINLDLPA